MILHRELRQIQRRRDFFIGQAVGHKADELELPRSEGLPIAILRKRWRGFLLSLFAQMLNQSHAKARGTSGFAADSGTHRRDDLRGGSVLEQVTTDSLVGRLQKNVGIFIHAEKKQLDTRVLGEDVAQKGQVGRVVEAIRQDNITMRGDYLVLNAFRMTAHANYVNLRAFFQEPRQGVAQQSVFGQEVDANLRA